MTTDNLADQFRQIISRIAVLVGREHTSPESVIDRVAYLAEREVQLDRTAATLKRVVGENELLREQAAELFAEVRRLEAERDERIAPEPTDAPT